MLWSIALCNNVCWQLSGPEFQQSVSAPYLTKIDATSSWSESNASHNGHPIEVSAPLLQRDSTTSPSLQCTESCSGVSPFAVLIIKIFIEL